MSNESKSSDERTEFELVPEAVQAIDWLNENFGHRLHKDNLDWLAGAFGDLNLSDDQLLSIGKTAFGGKRDELIHAIHEACHRNENLEFVVGSVFTPDQKPTLVCLRDGELFVVPLADRYLELTGFRRQDLSIIERRQRFKSHRSLWKLEDLQSQNAGTTDQGKMFVELTFGAVIDTLPSTENMLIAAEFWQGANSVTRLVQMDTPKVNQMNSVIRIEFDGGELESGKPVLVFVTALQSTATPIDDFPNKITRISNSVVRVLEVPQN